MNARRTPFRIERSLVIFLFASLALAGGPAAAAPLEALGPEGVASRIFLEVFSDGDLAVARELVSDAATIHTPEGDFTGSAGLGQYLALIRGPFPDATIAIQRTAVAGDTVHVWWSMTGTHLGDYRGIPATCGAVAIDGESFLRLENYLVQEQTITYDSQTVLDQIHVFNLFNPDGRPGCDDSQLLPERGAPACTKATTCAMPY